MADTTLQQHQSGILTRNPGMEQKLKLSAHQLHSVRILESSTVDLEKALRDLVNSNPLLELDTCDMQRTENEEKPDKDEEMEDMENISPDLPDPSGEFDPYRLSSASGERTPEKKEWEDFLEDLAEDPESWEDPSFCSLASSGEKDYPSTGSSTSSENDPKEYFFNTLTKEQNLKDLLMEELAFADVHKNIRKGAECIIGSLEENGYFTDPLTDVAQMADISLDEAEEALALVQKFDPPGVAASSLSECLLLQLQRQKKKDRILEKIIKEHLEDVGRNRLPYIAEKLKISMEKLSEELEKLKKLDPAPGIRYNGIKNKHIIPDVIVEEDKDGEFTVTLNSRSTPKLYFSHTYDSLISSPSLTAEEKNYFKEKTAEGKLAIYELQHRASTILRIANLIVSEQYEFMKHGGSTLKPLTMHLAADKLGVDDSTISRTCNEKYMLTPQGLFEFKYFFNTGFVNENGEEASNKAVMEMIREMIEEEDPSKPLSDEKLSALLKEKGYLVARRTVMKYRENMKIPSSQGRRKHIG